MNIQTISKAQMLQFYLLDMITDPIVVNNPDGDGKNYLYAKTTSGQANNLDHRICVRCLNQ